MAIFTATPALAQSTFNARVELDGGYDSNVFMADHGTPGTRSSWTASLLSALEWRPVENLSLRYSARAQHFVDESGEDNVRHNLGVRIADNGHYLLESTQTLVHGPRDAVPFCSGRNAWSTVHVRERRQQWQNRTRAEATLERGNVFLKPAASLVAFDLDLREQPVPNGHDHWIDRREVQAGTDFGWNTPDGAQAYLSWRMGRQKQGRQGGRPSDRSNDYHRVALGYAGKPASWLDLRVEAGPSFHRYDDPQSVGAQAIDSWYLNSRARITLSERDAVTGVAAISRGVASTGLLSSEQRNFSLNYLRNLRHRADLRVHGGAKLLIYDGRPIKDWVYSGGVAYGRQLTDTVRIQVDLMRERGRDRAPPCQPGREFTRTVASVGLVYRLPTP